MRSEKSMREVFFTNLLLQRVLQVGLPHISMRTTKMRLVSSVRQKTSCGKQYITGLLIVFILCIVHLGFFSRSNEHKQSSNNSNDLIVIEQYQPINRVDSYCHKNVPNDTEILFSSAEGSIFELKHLLVTIRHGDRSSIHSLPNAISHAKNSNDLLRPEAKSYVNYVTSFTLQSLPKTNPTAPKGEDLSQTLNPSLLFHTGDDKLAPGQLTSRGFLQHIELGFILQSKYQAFLRTISSSSMVYVRSTNYARTIQSVTALLLSLLLVDNVDNKIMLRVNKIRPQDTDKSPLKGINISYFETEQEEIMHGIGLRYSSHSISNATHSETEFAGECARAVKLAQQEREAFQRSSALLTLEKMFSDKVKRMGVTDIADGALPLLCHHNFLPCAGSQGKNLTGAHCMSHPLFQSIISDADRYYCNHYAGLQGGYEATKLSFYPFFSEIVSKLEAAAHPQSPSKLTLFSGHDTVIAPLLAVLGVYNQVVQISGKPISLCKWPGYASRIVFELHALIQNNVQRLANDSKPMLRSNNVQKYDYYPINTTYVRINYNGHDITGLIPQCVQYHRQLTEAVQSGLIGDKMALYRDQILVKEQSTLCPLAVLKKVQKSLLGPHDNLEQACNKV